MVEPNHFPRVRAAQPVVGLFVLPAVSNGLFEDAVLVAQAIAHRRQLHGRHGFDETGGQASQASVAQAGIRLLVEQFVPIDVLLAAGLQHGRVEQQVRYVARQRAADQELHREVVGALGIDVVVGLLGAQPAQRQHIAERSRDGLVASPGAWPGRDRWRSRRPDGGRIARSGRHESERGRIPRDLDACWCCSFSPLW